MDEDRLPGRGDETTEEHMDLIGGNTREIEGKRLEKIFHRPAPDDTVITQDDDRGNDRQQAQPLPAGAGSQFLHGPEGVGAAPAANDRFRKENREHQQEARQDIDDDEGGAAVFPHHIRKTPDVAESDGGTGHGHDDSKTAAEVFTFFHSRLEMNSRATPAGATNRMRK